MYDILFAPVGLYGDTSPEWEILCGGYSSITKACKALAGEITSDIATGNQYAYRIVEQEEE